MKLKRSLLLPVMAAAIYAGAQTPDSEYADKVVSYYYSQTNPYFTNLYGGEGYNFPISLDPHFIEGSNNSYFISLPTGSYMVLEFTNNKIIDYPGQDDIFVTENGCNNEKAEVYVSSDGKKFTRLGIVDDCYISSLDLASIGYKEAVRFVKIVGLDLNGGSPGFDLVNVKGLPKSSVAVNEDAVVDSLDNLANYGFTATKAENPAGNEWIIVSDYLKDAELIMYDVDKTKMSIHYKLIEFNKVIIDVAGLKAGVYTLEIKTGTRSIIQKIKLA
jgi:hypothetical protein